jgi:hypothetical protein
MPILKKLWSESPSLMLTFYLMLAALVASVAGLYLDARIITGAPAWLKPAKFAISTAIFAVSIAWLLQYLTVPAKRKRRLAGILSFALALEVFIIDLQAARGITSHFNSSTPLDGILFAVMGAGILVVWICMIWITVLLFRQRFADAAWGWALRLAMLITTIGAAAAGLMLPPNHQQTVQIQHHQQPESIGAHTVGAPDGGKGLPGTEWSAQHGDLRIPHFFGLHALQILPLCSWLMIRRRSRNATKNVFVLAASYLTFIAILAWQALRGQSIAEPDSSTLTVLAIWLAVTVGAFGWPKRGEPNRLGATTHSIA